MKQGTYLEAASDFEFKSAKLVKVKAGQLFWITNSEFDQTRTGHVLIQRKGKGHLSTGWPFAASDIETYFKAIA